VRADLGCPGSKGRKINLHRCWWTAHAWKILWWKANESLCCGSVISIKVRTTVYTFKDDQNEHYWTIGTWQIPHCVNDASDVSHKWNVTLSRCITNHGAMLCWFWRRCSDVVSGRILIGFLFFTSLQARCFRIQVSLCKQNHSLVKYLHTSFRNTAFLLHIESHILSFSGHVPGRPGLAGTISPFWILLELRMMEVVVTTGAIRRAKLQSNRHHHQTNPQYFYRPDALHYAQPTVSKHWREGLINAKLDKGNRITCRHVMWPKYQISKTHNCGRLPFSKKRDNACIILDAILALYRRMERNNKTSCSLQCMLTCN